MNFRREDATGPGGASTPRESRPWSREDNWKVRWMEMLAAWQV